MAKKVKKKVKAAKKTAKPKAAKKKTAVKKKKTATKKKTQKTAVKKTKTKKATAAKPKAKKVKKVVAKKKPARSKKKSSLTPQEIAKFQQLLLLKRSEILGDVEFFEEEALKKSRLEAAGDLSSMPIHMADMGTDNFEQEFSLGLMDNERKMVNEITAALWRIAKGVYGICEGTSNPISKPRLTANPWARYCIEYATMVEKGLIIEGEKLYEEDEEELPVETEATDKEGLADDEDDLDEMFYGNFDTDDKEEV